MPPLPVVSGRETINAFARAGWRQVRRTGSHIILTKPGVPVTLSVPDHNTLRRGTLRSLIRQAGLTVDEFVELLRG